MKLQSSAGDIVVDDGMKLYYEVVGNGEETVVVPLACWLARELESLATGRRMIFYDPRGRGRSDSVSDPSKLSFENDVRDLEAVRRHFGLERMSLAGWSYLGALVGYYAIEYPDCVDRLLLICPQTPRREPYGKQMEQLIPSFQSRIDPEDMKKLSEMQKAGIEQSDPAAYARQFRRVFYAMRMADSSAAERLRNDTSGLENESASNVMRVWQTVDRSMGTWDWREQLRTLKSEALVIHGMEDLIPLEASREWAACIPNARILAIPRVGHFPHAEAPEIFYPALEDFLSGKWPKNAEAITAQTQ